MKELDASDYGHLLRILPGSADQPTGSATCGPCVTAYSIGSGEQQRDSEGAGGDGNKTLACGCRLRRAGLRRVGVKASSSPRSDWADEATVVLTPVLRAVGPPDQGGPPCLATRPGQDLRSPPALVGAQHLRPAMPWLVPGAAHHHPSRDTPRDGFNRNVAGHKYNTLTSSILMRKSQGGTGVNKFRSRHAVAMIIMLPIVRQRPRSRNRAPGAPGCPRAVARPCLASRVGAFVRDGAGRR